MLRFQVPYLIVTFPVTRVPDFLLFPGLSLWTETVPGTAGHALSLQPTHLNEDNDLRGELYCKKRNTNSRSGWEGSIDTLSQRMRMSIDKPDLTYT